MSLDIKSIVEWAVLAILLIAGIYTAFIIKGEKGQYIKNAKEVIFFEFKLFIPHWWGTVDMNSDSIISYKRLDTRYDWQATFSWFNQGPDKDIIELYKDHINDRKILFDEENAIIHNPHSFIENDLIKSGDYEMVRLEGTATEDRSERLYYDAFLIRNLKTKAYMYAESKSSVLNGLVEGPYFEEVMLRLEKADQKTPT